MCVCIVSLLCAPAHTQPPYADVRTVFKDFRAAGRRATSSADMEAPAPATSRVSSRRGTQMHDAVGAVGDAGKKAGKLALGVATVGMKQLQNTLCNLSCCGYRASFGQMEVVRGATPMQRCAVHCAVL